MAFYMKLRSYIPDHAITTVPVLALLFTVHYFLLRDEPVEPGIELINGEAAFYQHWQRQLDTGDLDLDPGLERLELGHVGTAEHAGDSDEALIENRPQLITLFG